MKTETATLTDGRRVEFVPTVIGEGGFKRVYFTKDRTSVVCLYKDQARATEPRQLQRVQKLLTDFNPTLHADTGRYFADLFCWPTGIITAPEFGILAPAYPGHFF
ncbi:MAG TPA: hypothetical protein VD866_33540, partial [Urbifossiella sp.]|nr:hypothetical protein [Urbifossiella sp.]